jgi:hypothetical protein
MITAGELKRHPLKQVAMSCHYSVFGFKNMDIEPFLPLYLTILQTISNSYLGPTPTEIFFKLFDSVTSIPRIETAD